MKHMAHSDEESTTYGVFTMKHMAFTMKHMASGKPLYP
jgi:hypothetical protein